MALLVLSPAPACTFPLVASTIDTVGLGDGAEKRVAWVVGLGVPASTAAGGLVELVGEVVARGVVETVGVVVSPAAGVGLVATVGVVVSPALGVGLVATVGVVVPPAAGVEVVATEGVVVVPASPGVDVAPAAVGSVWVEADAGAADSRIDADGTAVVDGPALRVVSGDGCVVATTGVTADDVLGTGVATEEAPGVLAGAACWVTDVPREGTSVPACDGG